MLSSFCTRTRGDFLSPDFLDEPPEDPEDLPCCSHSSCRPGAVRCGGCERNSDRDLRPSSGSCSDGIDPSDEDL